MKGLFKLTVAAVALVGLASCSVDDLQSNSKQAPAAKGDLLVEVEDLIDPVTTRSAYTPDGKVAKLAWNTGDIIKVTDETALKYDAYSFDDGAFNFDYVATGRDKDVKVIDAPAYASHDAYDSQRIYWDNASMNVIGSFFIRSTMAWGEDTENEGAFLSEIPLWGTAEADDTYGVKVCMKYLTGVLKINMENVPGNVDKIRVTGWKNVAGSVELPMAGISPFEAVLQENDEIVEDAVLTAIEGGTYTNQIVIDVTGATQSNTVVFVPIIAQTYGLFTVEYSNDGGTSWDMITEKQNLKIERRKYYNLTKKFEKIGGDTPSAISKALAERASQKDIDLTCSNPTTLIDAAAGVEEDYTIWIPETSASTITLSLASVKKATTGKVLKIEPEVDYTGDLIINVGAGSDITAIDVNLPNANVTFNDCSLTGISLGEDDTTDGTNLNKAGTLVAKTLTIGSKTTIANVYANAEVGNGNTADADVLIQKGATVTKIEFETNYKADLIEINGTLTNELDMTTWKAKDGSTKIVSDFIVGGTLTNGLKTYGDVTVNADGDIKTLLHTDGDIIVGGVADAKASPVVVGGKITGAIQGLTAGTDAKNPTVKSITVKEDGSISGDIAPTVANFQFNMTLNGNGKVTSTAAAVKDLVINGDEASIATVTASGNATITESKEAEAITTSLTMTAGNTLTLNSGYIKAITVTPVTGKALAIKHGSEAAFAAIAAITGNYKVDASTKSVWNGKKVGEGRDAVKEAALITTLQTAYAAASKTNIFTATELASIAPTNAATLESNIDLNGENWTGNDLKADFKGANLNTAEAPLYPTIENLNLYAAINTKTPANIEGVGLFATASATAKISNLTIKEVTSDITDATINKVAYTVKAIGTLVGKAGANAITVENVAINTATVGALVSDNVGGLIGSAEDDVTIKKLTVTGLTLNGKFNVGGVIGNLGGTSKAVKFTDSADKEATSIAVAAINVPATFAGEPDIKTLAADQTNYGTVGMVAGVASSATTVTTPAKFTINDLITGNRETLGFKMCYHEAGPDVQYYFGTKPAATGKAHTYEGRISGATAAYVRTAAEYTSAAANTALYIKHSLYADYDK